MSKKDIEDIYSLSPLQQGMLFHALSAENSKLYFVQLNCTLRGKLDISALKRAWDRVAERHTVLRTSFAWKEVKKPVQIVHRHRPLDWVELDWRNLDTTEQKKALVEYAEADQARGYDMSKVPMRLALIRLEDETYHFIWSYHHVLMDGWSLQIIFGEALSFYRAFSNGQELNLPELTPFRAYIAWLQRQNLGEAEAFWRATLKNFLAPTPLPFDSGGSGDAPRYHGQHLLLARTTSTALQHLARQYQLTLNTIAQGAWALLLSRYSGNRDVLFGVIVSGRPAELPGVEAMVGPFINTLPLRVRLDEKQNVVQWLQQLQLDQLEARQYEYSPLAQVQGWSEIGRGHGLFDSLLVFQNIPTKPSSPQHQPASGIRAELNEQSSNYEKSNYSLTLDVAPGEQISLQLTYNQRQFSDETIARLLKHFQHLLEVFAAEPEITLAEVSLLSEAEKRQLLCDWNRTDTAYQAECVHRLFEQQVEQTPEQIAVEFGGERVSYRELNERANRLGRYLQEQGVGPEVIVGLCLERSVEMVVGVLGVLKAGGAYLPLDPGYPLERLLFMLEETAVPLLLTQERLRNRLPRQAAAAVITLDREWAERESEYERENIASEVRAENLSYVIYTSGSTGKPKGVMIPHYGLVNYLSWCTKAYAVAEGQGSAVHSSISFDLTITSLFAPLVVGRSVVLLPEEQGIEGLASALSTPNDFSLIKITPAHLELLSQMVPAEKVSGKTRAFIIGGEELRSESLEFWRTHSPATRLINEYGPTESVVGCCVYEVADGDPSLGPVPIGKPIANTELYIVDEQMQPVPVGVIGELYIGGVGLARGYWRRPELTAEKFVPHPFSERAGARLYRTGDLARYLADGRVEFLGRRDQQVKLRGYRIELGEIAAALTQHPAVRESVVVLRAEPTGDKRLVAYVVPEYKEAQAAIASHQLYTLPNGLEIAHLNKSETDYIYKEIFEDHVYLKNGISIADGDIVFDVGANIGLFTLFVQQRWPHTRVFAFEPLLLTFQTLTANVSLYGLNVKPYNCGLSNRTAQAEFTFYPKMSLMSGAYCDVREEESVTRAYMDRKYGAMAGYADEILEGRYESETCLCPVKKLSDIIKAESIERIDLLKIDVEKSELDVLQGIDDEDWSKIKQLIIEVYDKDGRLGRITELLGGRGYMLQVEQEESLETTPLYNVYAIQQTAKTSEGKEKAAETGADLSKRSLPVELRTYLRDKLPEYMIPAVVVEMRELPLTANGKVDLRALPEPDGARPELGAKYEGPRNEVEAELCRLWAAVLGLERVGIHDNFFDLGGDSILSIQIVARANQKGLRLAHKHLFEHRTVAELAAVVDTTPVIVTEQGEVRGEQRLTPVQQWFFSQQSAEPHHWNQTRLVSVSGRLQPELLKGAVGALLRHHDALRQRFSRAGEGAGKGWQAHYAAVSSATAPFTVHDLSGVAVSEQRGEIERLAAAAQSSLDLSEGPLLQVHYYKLGVDESGTERGRLLMVIHHLAVDIVSWGILLEDLQRGYEQLEQGAGEVQLPAKTTSYQQWAEVLQAYAKSLRLLVQIDYWLDDKRCEVAPLPTDFSYGENLESTTRHLSINLNVEETQKLVFEVSKAANVQVNEVLLTVLAETLSQWTGDKHVLIDVEGHGREETIGEVDLTRTVGWFTTFHPALLTLEDNASWEERLRMVTKQLRAVPKRGIGYGVLRYLTGKKDIVDRLESLPQPEIAFNYSRFVQGQEQEPERLGEGALRFGPAPESPGPLYSARARRTHLLEVNASIAGQQLSVRWSFSDRRHERATVERLAQEFLNGLRGLIGSFQESEVQPQLFSPGIEESFAIPQLDDEPPFWAPLVPLQQRGSKAPFFCVHPAGGTVLPLVDLARQFSPDRPFYGLQAVGLYGEREPYITMEEMAARYVDEIRLIQPEGPYVIGGFSYGGNVAFEMAQQLHNQNQAVSLLAIIDTIAPSFDREQHERTHDPDAELLSYATKAAESRGKKLSLTLEEFKRLHLDAQVEFVMDELRANRIFSNRVSSSDTKLRKARRSLKVFQNHGWAIRNYRPRVYPDRITLFRTIEKVDIEAYQHMYDHPFFADPAMGWGPLSTEPIEIYRIPGHHGQIVTEPNVGIMAQHMRACLEKRKEVFANEVQTAKMHS